MYVKRKFEFACYDNKQLDEYIDIFHFPVTSFSTWITILQLRDIHFSRMHILNAWPTHCNHTYTFENKGSKKGVYATMP